MTPCRPGCATGSTRSRWRPAISCRWSANCSTCHGSRAAGRSAPSTSSTWVGSAVGFDGAPAPLRRSTGRRAAARRRRAHPAGPWRPGSPGSGRRQPGPQRGEVQPRWRRRHGLGPSRGGRGRRRRRRPRRRDPEGGAGADLRAVLQGRSRARPRGRPAGPGWGWRSPGTSSSSTAVASGSKSAEGVGSTFSFSLPIATNLD